MTVPQPSATSVQPFVLGTAIPSEIAGAGMARPALVPSTVEEREPDGRTWRRKVTRIAEAPLIRSLPQSRRKAADTYAATYEVVNAGGGGGGAAMPEKVDGGKGAAEGKQAMIVQGAVFLSRMDRAIGDGHIALNRHGPTVAIRTLVVLMTVSGRGVRPILDALDVRRTTSREQRVANAITDALGRVAVEIGLEMATPKSTGG